MNKIKIVLAGLVFLSLRADGLALNESLGKVEFLAVARPTGIKISGKGDGPSGELDLAKAEGGYSLKGQIEMKLDSFSTGIGMRDRHMKERYLEVDKFPEAKMNFSEIKLSKEVIETGGLVSAPGTLTMHGKSHPVVVAMTISRKGAALMSSAKFKLKLSDFEIKSPTFAGITVDDEVQVTAEVQVSTEVQLPFVEEGKKL